MFFSCFKGTDVCFKKLSSTTLQPRCCGCAQSCTTTHVARAEAQKTQFMITQYEIKIWIVIMINIHMVDSLGFQFTRISKFVLCKISTFSRWPFPRQISKTLDLEKSAQRETCLFFLELLQSDDFLAVHSRLASCYPEA